MELLKEHLERTRYDIDTAAGAIILCEKGVSYLDEGKIIFRLTKTVKILTQEAANELSRIGISYDEASWVRDIEGTTYNLENGVVTAQKLQRPDMLRDKVTKNISVAKFNLPSVKAGSVIEYVYTKEQPGALFIPDWVFQHDYPTLVSEYDINLPDYVVYTAIERTNLPMVKVKKEWMLDTCQSCSFEHSYGGSSGRTWLRRNIPAIRAEPYMSSPDNYKERVKIHVTAIARGGITTNIYNNWNDFSRKYYYEDKSYCGQPYAANSFLNEKVAELTRDKTNELEKARAIFSYVRDNFNEKNTGGPQRYDIKTTYYTREGSYRGINLLLTAMLRKAGINSAPVLLSTRQQERLSPLYPDPYLVNYLASVAMIGDRRYFLDASEKNIPFGILLPQCYNGYCRIITEKGAEAILNPDSVIDKNTIVVSMLPAASGTSFTLRVDEQFGVFSGWHYRNEWTSDTAALRKKILQDLASMDAKIELKSYSLKYLDNPDLPLSLHYEATLDMKEHAGFVYFDPFFCKFFKKNPFHATSRTYMIEMDYLQDINYLFRLQLPNHYTIDDYPRSSHYKFGEEELVRMKNIMKYDEASRSFSLNSRYTTRTCFFAPEEYTGLRGFYEHIIDEQNKKVVFKKQ